MDNSKRLYFIPIIARALRRGDQERAMTEAFEEIKELGKLPGYKEGFRQFLEFVDASLKLSNEEPENKTQLMQDVIHRLMFELATETYEGEEEQKEALIAALKRSPEWYNEFERIKAEAQAFLAPETPLEVEVSKDDMVIGSFPASTATYSISSVRPGKYTVRLSNGRVLWEGELTREHVLWAYAFPQKDLPMAAETEPSAREPTKTISLLDGELTMQVFAGLETGQIRFRSVQGI